MIRSHAFTLLKASIGLILIVLVVWKADWSRLVAILRGADIVLFAAACVCFGMAIAANAWRWMEVMAQLGAPLSVRDAIVGSFEANFFNLLLPSSVGGDPIRALRSYDAGARPGQALLGVIIDRAYGLWFMAAAVVGLMLWSASPVMSAPAFTVVGAAAIIATVGAFAAVGVGMLPLERWLPSWLQPAVALVQGFSELARRPMRLVAVIVTLILSNVALLASFTLCARSLGLHLGLVDGALAMLAMLLAAMIPVSIGGWGIREGVAVLLLTATGASPAQAVAVSILFGLAMTVVAIAGGVIWALAPYRRISAQDALAGLTSKGRSGPSAPRDPP